MEGLVTMLTSLNASLSERPGDKMRVERSHSRLYSAQRAARNCDRYAFSHPRTPTVLKSTLLACCGSGKVPRYCIDTEIKTPSPQYDRQASGRLERSASPPDVYVAYDTSIVPGEWHRANLSGCYLFLACTGCRPAEIVDNEKKKPKDGSWEELYGPKAVHAHDRDRTMRRELVRFDSEHVAAQVGTCEYDDAEDKLSDEDARLLEEMLSAETTGRGRPKALCYEDILLMVVRHPVTGEDVHVMAVKLIHHKGTDNKPKPIAVDDSAFDAPSLTNVRAVFEVKNTGPIKCTPLRWKKEWLKRRVFRRFNGPNISEDEALQYHKLREDMGRQSLDAGEEKPMQPKDWRRGAANEANGKSVSVDSTADVDWTKITTMLPACR
ncbi:hypothetical protein GE09DRAFT_588621 [Coniochaeta sp. 2T2.1]|nr:hypothetical protein GE09DRAFT_588621 [Coniochaeta sp. 2T2.1]